MFFAKNKKPTLPSPSWFKWLVIGFLVYAIASNYVQHDKGKPSTLAANEFSSPADATPLSTLVDVQTKDITEGVGAPIRCGQEAEISYKATTHTGELIEEKATRLVLGARKAMPALERAVEGMRVGGMRSLVAPVTLAYGAKGFANDKAPKNGVVNITLSLKAAHGALPVSTIPLRSFTTQKKDGALIACGEPVSIKRRVTDARGSVVFEDAAPVQAVLDGTHLPYGIEEVLLQSRKGEKVTVLLPPTLRHCLNECGKTPIPWPENEISIVDLEIL